MIPAPIPTILVCHAAWMPERKRTLARLLEQVPEAKVLSSERREPALIWARRAWEFAAAEPGPTVILNDDVTVCPDFERVVTAIAAAAPGRAISLHTSAPGAEKLDGTSWARCYWYTGPGVMLWPEHARALLEYWAELPAGFGPNEDNVAIQWAWGRQEPFWSTIPAVVRHDTSTKSSLGYDNHALRSSNVDWATMKCDACKAAGAELGPGCTCVAVPLADVEYWRRGVDEPPFLENPWAKADGLERMRRALATPAVICQCCWERPAIIKNGHVSTCVDCVARARRALPTRYKLFVATPYRADGLAPEYLAAILGLQRLFSIEVEHEAELGARHEHDDLVRVRSRMLRQAYESGATHMLLGDADNAWEPEVVVRMLRTGKDFVQCPYLGRDGRGYRIRPLERDRIAGRTADEHIEPDGTIEIEHTGLGLTLISRECMKRMVEHYEAIDRDRVDLDAALVRLEAGTLPKGEAYTLLRRAAAELTRWRAGHMGLATVDLDRATNELHETVALFKLMVRDRVLMSEDASFAARWRDLGGKVWMYIGPGSPIAHYGRVKFQGKIEDLGFSHGEGAQR